MSDVPESHGKDDTRLGMDERRTAPEHPTASLRQLVVELPHNLDDVRMRAQSIPGIGDFCEGLTDRRVRTYRPPRDLVEGSVDSRLDIGRALAVGWQPIELVFRPTIFNGEVPIPR
jgi:hypothetical protein